MKSLPYEIWRDIPGFEGKYQASTMGNIRSVSRYVVDRLGYRFIKGRELKICVAKTGYNHYYQSRVALGFGNTKIVSRLIASTFIPNPKNLPEVNHKDENPQNNQVTNLEWCDGPYNKNYGTRNERIGEKLKNHKSTSIPVVQLTLDGVEIKHWPSIKEIERVLGFNNTAIGRCCRGGRPTAYGYKWKFLKQK